MIEKTVHFFGDAVDLEKVETGEMVTLPMWMYKEMSERMWDGKIFEEIAVVHREDIYLPALGRWITL